MSTQHFVRCLVAIAGGVCMTLPGATAFAGLTQLDMSMKSKSESCKTNCLTFAAYTTDTDTAAAPPGSFGNLSVATQVAAATNALAVNASGETTITSDTSFNVHLLTNRPGAPVEGTYTASAELRFQFHTDAAGTMKIEYIVQYDRPSTGPTLDTGIGFSSPYLLQILGGSSAEPLSFDSLSGTSPGSWTYDLDTNTTYVATLSAYNSSSFFAAAGYPLDRIDANYTVTLPSFAQAVPEPVEWALMLAGLGLIGAAARRRRT